MPKFFPSKWSGQTASKEAGKPNVPASKSKYRKEKAKSGAKPKAASKLKK